MGDFDPKDPAEFGFEQILYEKRDGVARITFNRPRVYNCINAPTLHETLRALTDASWDDAVGVLVLTGAGNEAFCTGGDVKEYSGQLTKRPHDYWKWMGVFTAVLDMLRNLGKPTIARLNGMVVGGGNEFNLSCDMAIAADHVRIRQVGAQVGSVAAGGATQWLPIVIGDRRAREMLYTCDWIDAQTALQWGLVNRVVPADQLDKAVDELIAKLMDKFPECIRYTKQQVNFWKDLSWHMTIGHAREWLSLHMGSVEAYEGMKAFVDKRQPDRIGLRQKAARGGTPEFLWGAYEQACRSCGAQGIPADFRFCGACGARLEVAATATA